MIKFGAAKASVTKHVMKSQGAIDRINESSKETYKPNYDATPEIIKREVDEQIAMLCHPINEIKGLLSRLEEKKNTLLNEYDRLGEEKKEEEKTSVQEYHTKALECEWKLEELLDELKTEEAYLRNIKELTQEPKKPSGNAKMNSEGAKTVEERPEANESPTTSAQSQEREEQKEGLDEEASTCQSDADDNTEDQPCHSAHTNILTEDLFRAERGQLRRYSEKLKSLIQESKSTLANGKEMTNGSDEEILHFVFQELGSHYDTISFYSEQLVETRRICNEAINKLPLKELKVEDKILRSLWLDSGQLLEEAKERKDELWEVKNRLERRFNYLAHIRSSRSNRTSEADNSARWKDEDVFNTSNEVTRMKLQPIPIPKFNGQWKQWINFWTLFKINIHDRKIDNISKFNYLLQALQGEPKEMVERFQISESNYVKAVELLQSKYGNNRERVYHLNKELTDIRPKSQEVKDQRRCWDKVIAICEQLEECGEPMESQLLQSSILEKFSEKIRKRFLKKVVEEDMAWNWMNFRTSIERIVNNLEELSKIAPVGDGPDIPKKQKKDNSIVKNTDDTKEACIFCQRNNHRTEDCFTVFQNDIRWDRWKAKNLCTKCGSLSHQSDTCKAEACSQCGKNHHIALCKERNTERMEKRQLRNSSHNKTHPWNVRSEPFVPTGGNAEPLGKPPVANTAMTATRWKMKSYLMISQVLIQRSNTSMMKREANIFFDNGANMSFIRTKVAAELKLDKVGHEDCKIQGISGTMDCTQDVVRAFILNSDGSTTEVLLRTMDDLPTNMEEVHLGDVDSRFIAMRNIPLDGRRYKGEVRDIDILIGMDNLWKFKTGEPEVTLPSGLELIKLSIGNLISGTMHNTRSEPFKSEVSVFPVCESFIEKPEESMEETFTKLLEFQNTGVEEFQGASAIEKKLKEQDILEQFNKDVERREDGYYVKMPWKRDKVKELPDNFQIALCRLKGVYQRICKDEWALKEYDKTFKDQHMKGIIEEVDIGQEPQGTLHYLAHQPVFTPMKETTKLRIVFDASAHLKDKPSLNDVIEQGPLILPELIGLLLRWRTKTIGIASDVEKAFLQIRLREDDRDATRFLWLKDPSKPFNANNIRCYRYTRVTFGINCSPFLLGATIQYHLKATEDNKDLAAKIMNNVYVDNLLLTTDDLTEGQSMCLQAKKIFLDMSMNLREFTSNCEAAVSSLADSDKSKNREQKILGVKWIADDDQLQLDCRIEVNDNEVVTKRIVSQQLAGLYDPLGVLLPITIKGRQFLQNLWRGGYSWESILSKDDVDKWNQIRMKISAHGVVSFPRNVTTKEIEHKVVICCDASGSTMATCAYLVSQEKSDLICSRAKLQSIKKAFTIPKLEMNALTMGTRLAWYLVEELRKTVEFSDIVILSDSEIALNWIKRQSIYEKGTVMVQNRKREITQIVEQIECKHIKVRFGYIHTKSNPADAATRGWDSKSQRSEELWWHGADFFKNDEKEWPDETRMFEAGKLKEEKVFVATQLQEQSDRLFAWNRYSSLHKMKRVYAYIMKFIAKKMLRNGHVPESLKHGIPEFQNFTIEKDISAINVKASKMLLIKRAQREEDWKGNTALKAKLGVRVDVAGVERCHGRFGKAYSDEEKAPILLSKNSGLSTLIVQEAHECLHKGPRHTMATVRKQYWIPQLASLTKKVTRSCVPCQKLNNLPFYYPDMGDLPEARVIRSHPFKNTGLDYIGPIEYSSEATGVKKKAYICLFTCLCTRMIHLEITSDQTTEKFINCIRRFVSRRGVPESIVSDNAPSFILGKEILRDAFLSRTLTKEGQEYMVQQEINWKHIVAYAPWQGAVYERLIKDIKASLYKSIGGKILTWDELHTWTTEIEGSMNSRPISALTSEFENRPMVRPIDFYQKDIILTIPLGGARTEDDMTYMNSEERLRLKTRMETEEALRSSYSLSEKFWKYWKEDYLASLRDSHVQRMKTGRGIETPKEGQIVLIKDDNIPRNQWRLARIIEVNQKNDVIRDVVVKSPTGRTSRRPVNLLIPLEIEGAETQGIVRTLDKVHEETSLRRSKRVKARVNYQEESEDESEDVARGGEMGVGPLQLHRARGSGEVGQCEPLRKQ